MLFTAVPTAYGHGMMCTPRQRGAYKSVKCGFNHDIPKNPVTDHCAHCLNGGAVGTVMANLPKSGWEVYDPTNDFDGTANRAGLCGDAKGSYDHMIGGDFFPSTYKNVPFMANWKTGGVVDMSAEIDTNHNGYFEFFLCDLDSCGSSDISARCFRRGNCHRLRRVPHPDCQDRTRNTHYECGPIDTKYPSRWYLPCRNTGHVGTHIVGGPAGTMRYRLPPGVVCKHCVLQWYWATSNSCAPRGLLEYMERNKNPFGTKCESDGGGLGTYRKGMRKCGGKVIPEEFWSCSDVQVTNNGKAAGQVRAVGMPTQPPPASTGPDVKKNPNEVLEKVKDELEKDIDSEAKESELERKRQEREAAKGHCIREGSRCDGGVHCCDLQQVCVYQANRVGFTCRFWWSLWEEAELQEKRMGRKKSKGKKSKGKKLKGKKSKGRNQ